MKAINRRSALLVSVALAIGVALSPGFLSQNSGAGDTPSVKNSRSRESGHKTAVERKKLRDDYFDMVLRDPRLGRIPAGIAGREMEAARKRPTFESIVGKTATVNYEWKEAGPTDVGGRSRTILVDVGNADALITAGVSGGIWKSVNRGASWTLVSENHLTVTSIAQDTRPGQTATWYASTGERRGSFNDNASGQVSLFGTGLYKSTDGGSSWTLVQSAGNRAAWDTVYDLVARVVVSPATGSIFLADHSAGIWRSADGGQSFSLAHGTSQAHPWNDIAVDAAGNLLAVHSGSAATATTGIFRSTDDGLNWTAVGTAPAPFDLYFERVVIALAPSNPDVAYLYTYMGEKKAVPAGQIDDIRFHKVRLSTGTYEDRSANLPLFTDGAGVLNNGQLDTQQNYNQVMAVHPLDENHVFIGGTVLYRSRDGFATAAADRNDAWIGGYSIDDNNSQYAGSHPDHHTLFFDPHNPNRLYNGHDGGLSVSQDVSPNGQIVWSKLNNGFNVTQFFTLSIARAANDDRVLGGTQDNGSPFFRFDGTTTTASNDVSTGDGGYAALLANGVVSSAQNGSMWIEPVSAAGTPDFQTSVAFQPCSNCGALFVNPATFEPNDESTFFYPAGADLYRSNGTVGNSWTQLNAMTLPTGFGYSALSMSTAPRGILYVSAYSESDAPKILRLSGAETSTAAPEDRSIPGLLAGTYVMHIAVNPADGDEILVSLSNYGIVSLYHSSDGGQTYTAAEGNLSGIEDGPSVRAGAIALLNGEKTYFAGTSTGLYATTTLAGDQTVWAQMASGVMGQAPVAWIDSRISDGRVAIATHGRGVFMGYASSGVANAAPVAQDGTGSANEDATATITLSATDPENGTLTYSLTGQPSNGSAVLAGTQVTYTPSADYNGADTFTFTASDGSLSSNTATVTVTVASVNDAPSFTAGANQSVGHNAGAQTLNAWATAISSGPANESAQTLSFEVSSDNSALFATVPAISGDGTLTFESAANASGTATVTAVLVDNGGTANGGVDRAGSVTFTITVAAAGSAVAAQASLDTSEDTPSTVTLTGTSSAGGTLVFALASQPANGTATLDGAAATYTPSADYFGADSFTFTVSDGSSTSAAAAVAVAVGAVNDAPSFTAGANQSVDRNSGPQSVAAWASDVSAGPANESGQTLTFSVTTDNDGLFASAPTVSADGTLAYTAVTDGSGVANVTVALQDDGGTANGGFDMSAGATFAIQINETSSAITAAVRFAVDMTAELNSGNALSTDQVGVFGSVAPLSWTDLFVLNDTNGDGVYEGPVTFTLNPQSVVEYKFGYRDPSTGDSWIETTVGAGTDGARVFTFDGAADLGTAVYEAAFGTASEADGVMPTDFALTGSYPNPFNPSTSITFDLPETALVSVVVSDILGRVVLTIPAQSISAGSGRTIQVDGSGLPSGSYVYTVLLRNSRSSQSRGVQSGTFVLLK